MKVNINKSVTPLLVISTCQLVLYHSWIFSILLIPSFFLFYHFHFHSLKVSSSSLILPLSCPSVSAPRYFHYQMYRQTNLFSWCPHFLNIVSCHFHNLSNQAAEPCTNADGSYLSPDRLLVTTTWWQCHCLSWPEPSSRGLSSRCTAPRLHFSSWPRFRVTMVKVSVWPLQGGHFKTLLYVGHFCCGWCWFNDRIMTSLLKITRQM